MIEFLKKWWFVIIDTIVDFIDKRDNDRLAKISNMLAILLMVIGFISWVFKTRKNKKKTLIQKAANTTKPPKYLSYLEDPFEKGEELGELTSDIYNKGGKKMKDFFKKLGHGIYVTFVWLKGNWENLYTAFYVTLGSVIANIIFYNDGLHAIFGEGALWTTNTYVKIAITVVSVLGAITTWYTATTKDKFYSFKTLVERVKIKEEEKEKRRLTKEQLERKQLAMDKLLGRYNEIQDNIDSLKDKLFQMENDYNTCHALVPNYDEERSKIEREIEVLIPTQIELKTSIEKMSLKED